MGYQARLPVPRGPGPRASVRGHRMCGGVEPQTRLRRRWSSRSTTPSSATAAVAVTGLPVIVDDVETPDQPIASCPAPARSACAPGGGAAPGEAAGCSACSRVTSSAPGRFGGGGHGAARRRGQPRRPRRRSGRELPDHRGPVPGSGGQGAGAHRAVRAPPTRSCRRPIAICRRRRCSSSSARRWPRWGSSWPASPTSSTTPSGSSTPTSRRSRTSSSGSAACWRSTGDRPLPPADPGQVQAEWEQPQDRLRAPVSRLHDSRASARGPNGARKIVRDLRVFARSQDDVWQSVDLHEEIESSLTLLNHLLKDRVVVHRKLGALPPVECIRSQIDQVFLNLLANAGQAIAGRGASPSRPRWTTGTQSSRSPTAGPASPPPSSAGSSTRSSRPSPWARAPASGSRISYEIVKKHGGELAGREPGRRRGGVHAAHPDAAADGMSEPRRPILLVDDEPRVLDSLEALARAWTTGCSAPSSRRRARGARHGARRGRRERSADAGDAGTELLARSP